MLIINMVNKHNKVIATPARPAVEDFPLVDLLQVLVRDVLVNLCLLICYH